MQDIPEKLKTLRRIRQTADIFGGIGCSSKISEQALCRLESQCCVSLPTEFREFLSIVGHGAGPFYGIFSPKEILEELNRPCVGSLHFPDDFSPEQTFGIDPEAANKCLDLLRVEAEEPWISHPFPANGTLTICSQGCTFWSVIVTAGPLTGTVWDVACDFGNEGQWTPADRPVGALHAPRSTEYFFKSVPTFLEWYSSWLDRYLEETKISTMNEPQLGIPWQSIAISAVVIILLQIVTVPMMLRVVDQLFGITLSMWTVYEVWLTAIVISTTIAIRIRNSATPIVRKVIWFILALLTASFSSATIWAAAVSNTTGF